MATNYKKTNRFALPLKFLLLSIFISFLTACPMSPQSTGLNAEGDPASVLMQNNADGADTNIAPAEDESNNPDAEFESEGVFSLPVTPSKAIDAMGISYQSQAQQNTISIRDEIIPSALAEDRESSCYLMGQAETTDPQVELILSWVDDESQFIEFTSSDDGSFQVALPESYLGRKTLLRARQDEAGEQALITMVDQSCQYYSVALNLKSQDLNGETTTFADYIFYNQRDLSGQQQIAVRSLHGGQVLDTFDIVEPLQQMRYFPDRFEEGVLHEAKILAMTNRKDVVALTRSGEAFLNDFSQGMMFPLLNQIVDYGQAMHSPSFNGEWTVLAGSHAMLEDQNMPLIMIPSFENEGDVFFENTLQEYVRSQNVAWIDATRFVLLNQYEFERIQESESESKEGDFDDQAGDKEHGQSDFYNVASIHDMSNLIHLSPDEREERRRSPDIQTIKMSEEPLFATSVEISNPVPSPTTSKARPYLIMKAMNPQTGHKDLVISDYEKHVFLPSLNRDVSDVDVSVFGDFIAFSALEEQGGKKVYVTYLPTLTTVPVMSLETVEGIESIEMPKFSRDFAYGLSFKIRYKDRSSDIAVVNLEKFSYFAKMIEMTRESDALDLSVIFSEQGSGEDVLTLDFQQVLMEHGLIP